MKRQIMKLTDCGHCYSIIRDSQQENEYALYYHFRDIGKNGYPVNHKKLVDRYLTLWEALDELKDRVGAVI